MESRTQKTIRLLAATAALIAAVPASAALLDRGPTDAFGFPQWYRDLNGTAVGLCLSQVASPNAPGGPPMCFPLAADPAGFAGNLGPEIFYNNLNVLIGKGAAAGGTQTFALRYVAGLEASYLPLGVPVHGTETVFARIRIVINAQVTGRYTVTHPFGIEVFDVTSTGPRSVFFTADVPLAAPMNFDGALDGRIGPFIEWDTVDAGMTLDVAGQRFLGDPNIAHTFKGSPFGWNFVEVVGPVGADLGNGTNVIREVLGNVEGQRWLAPIATAFKIDRAVYSTSPVTGLNTVDVWASSAPAQKLVVTGLDMPSLQLAEYLPGFYYGHIEYASATPTPSGINVTNLTSNPVNTLTTSLTDQVDATASFDPVTGNLTVNASTSDLTGPKLVAESQAFPQSAMGAGATPGTASVTVTLPSTTEPPKTVRVVSAAGGVAVAELAVGSGKPMNNAGVATAVNDGSNAAPLAVAGSGPSVIDVLGNDLNTSLPGSVFTGSVLVLSAPANGTAVANANGTITYTPKVGSQGIDSFTYAVQTPAGNPVAGISNVATVTVTVPFVAPPPTANADNFAMLANTSRTYNVIGNDVAGAGTSLDPASVRVVTQPANGSAVANANGTITYTPRAGFNSALDTFTYTVSSNTVPASTSNAATVTVDVFGGAESVSISKATYTVSKSRWTIVGSTNWFNAALTQTVASCYLLTSGGKAVTPAPAFIGSALVDTTGKFQIVPTGPTPTPTSPATVRCSTSNGGTKDGGVVFN